MLLISPAAVLYKVFLESHNVFGFVSLISFWSVIFIKKGGDWHRRLGQIYMVAMIFLSLTGIFCSILAMTYTPEIHPKADPQVHLTFSIYLIQLGFITLTETIAGAQYIRHKNDLKKSVNFLTVGTRIASSLITLLVIYVGYIYNDLRLLMSGILLSLVFNVNFVYVLNRIFNGQIKKNTHLFWHMRAMVSSGTALHLAFMTGGAVLRYWPNFYAHVGNLVWYVPIPVGLLLDYLLVRRYKKVMIQSERNP